MTYHILEARHTHDELIRKYNRIASIYDLFGILYASKARERALELADVRDTERILEVALGTGQNFIQMLRKNPNGWVDGVDVSRKMLNRANRKIAKTGQRNYALHLCDCRHLPFEDASFDIVMNQYLLDILPVEDFEPILLEFKRVLKKAGRLVLVNTTRSGRWVNQIYEQLYKLRTPIVAGSRGIQVQPFVDKLGFTKVRREFVSQFGFPSEIVSATKT